MTASTEAVMFFREGSIVKEMYFSEFEAVLDDVVGIADFAGDEVQAVFLQINGDLKVTGAVFFLISFDARGRVTGNWNIPLRHLMDYASLGPDMGAGPIKVACFSACPVEWYQKHLWDPEMKQGRTFRQIAEAVERNRLSIIVERRTGDAARPTAAKFFSGYKNPEVPVTEAREAPVFNRRYRQKRKALIAKYQLAMATQEQEFRQQKEALENIQARELSDRDQQLKTLQGHLDEELRFRRKAESQLQRHKQMLEEKTAELEKLLAEGGKLSEEELLELRGQYQQEADNRIAALKLEYEELVQKREKELYARATEIVDLRAQLSEFREQNQALMISGGDHLLDDMVKKGVVFVAYHPGIEHLLINKDEMVDYLSDPLAFAASRCEVSVSHYKEWLTHYRLPICRELEAGHYCGRPVEKVLRPRLFRSGETDRCAEHRHASQS